MLKQVVWTHFEPVLPRFSPRKIPKCLEKGLVQHHGSKLGKKRNFLKVIMGHLGGLEKCFYPVLSPRSGVLAHGESQNALKMGHYGTKTSEILSPFRYRGMSHPCCVLPFVCFVHCALCS